MKCSVSGEEGGPSTRPCASQIPPPYPACGRASASVDFTRPVHPTHASRGAAPALTTTTKGNSAKFTSSMSITSSFCRHTIIVMLVEQTSGDFELNVDLVAGQDPLSIQRNGEADPEVLTIHLPRRTQLDVVASVGVALEPNLRHRQPYRAGDAANGE